MLLLVVFIMFYIPYIVAFVQDLGRRLCGNQPVRRERTGITTPSGRRRVDGVEVDAAIQHERAVKF